MSDLMGRRVCLAYGMVVLLGWTVPLNPAKGEDMQYPLSAAVAADGTIYVADQNAPAIWQFKGGKLEKFFEGSKKIRTPLNRVRCLAIDADGKLLAGDSSTREVYRFDDAGQPVPLTNGGIGMPRSIIVLSDGNLLVADQEEHCIWKVPGAGGKPVRWAEVPGLVAICRDQDGIIWGTSGPQVDLCKVTEDGQVEQAVTDAAIQFPQEVAVDAAKNVYLADTYAQAIWKIPLGKRPEKLAASAPLSKPVGVTWAGDALLVTDAGAKAVFRVAPDGTVTKVTP